MTGEEELANKLKHKAPTSTWESGFNDGIDALLAAVKSRVVLPGNLVTLTVKERDDLIARVAALEADLKKERALRVQVSDDSQRHVDALVTQKELVGRLVEALKQAHDEIHQDDCTRDSCTYESLLADLDATR